MSPVLVYGVFLVVGAILGMAIQDAMSESRGWVRELQGPLRIAGESPAEAIANAVQVLHSFVFLNDRERAGRKGLKVIRDATARLNGALVALRTERKVS